MVSPSPVVGIIDYRAGNSRSVAYALDHLKVEYRLMEHPDEAADVDRVILPGVGAAGTTMDYLGEAGWLRKLDELVIEGGVPFLGICVGMQLLFERSAEQDAECMGWLPGEVLPFDRERLKVPQIGWNQVVSRSSHPFVAALPESGHFYFVNSFYAQPGKESDIAGVTEYGHEFTAIVARNNIMGTQFHCEKSGPLGLRLLRGFTELDKETLC